MVLKAKKTGGHSDKTNLIKELTKEKPARFNAHIPADLYKNIKLKSVKEGRTISEITIELWTEYLSKNKE